MILAIRHRRIVLSLLFVASVIIAGSIYLTLQGKVILENIQYFVEDRLGAALDAKVTMDSIHLHYIIGPIVLKGFSLTKATAQDTPFIFKSDKVILYNNMPRLVTAKLFKKFGEPLQETLVFKIENGSLYKGDKPILQNMSGHGRIVKNNFIFNDITGKCYDFPLTVYGKVSSDTTKIDLNIRSASERLRGKIYLSNYVLTPHAVGTIEFNNGYKLYLSTDLDIKPGEKVSFKNTILQNSVFASGELDFFKKKFYAELKKKRVSGDTAPPKTKDSIQLICDFSKQGLLEGSVFFNHLAIGRLDLQSQLDFQLAFTEGGLNSGKINTSGTILDYRPFKEAEGEFLIEEKVLKIPCLKLGEDYSLEGFIALYKPYEMDLTVNIKDGSLSQLLLVSDAESEGKVSGKINGQIRINGPFDNLATTAKLECGRGKLANLDYESMNVNLRGSGSVLKVTDSRILREEGYIDLTGEVDLNHLWSQEPAKGLDWACGNEAIVWDGWDIIKQADSKELEMKKGIGREKEFMVTFKGYLNDEQSWQDSQGPRQNETVGVAYNLDDAKKVKMQIKNNEEIFSLENKIKF